MKIYFFCGVDAELSEVLPKHIAELYLTVRLMHSPVLTMNYLRRPVNELYQRRRDYAYHQANKTVSL